MSFKFVKPFEWMGCQRCYNLKDFVKYESSFVCPKKFLGGKLNLGFTVRALVFLLMSDYDAWCLCVYVLIEPFQLGLFLHILFPKELRIY